MNLRETLIWKVLLVCSCIAIAYCSWTLYGYYNDNETDLRGNKIGFFSYGSGSKSKVFEGVIQKNWKNKINNLKLFSKLKKRNEIEIETYEKLHNKKLDQIIHKQNRIQLSHIETKENIKGLRVYSSN